MIEPLDRDRKVFFDVDRKSQGAQRFHDQLAARIIGQEPAVRALADLYQIFLAEMNPAHRPVGTLLFLGPTGAGKTRVAEAAAEVLFGDARAMVKIDCGEFQHSHEIAKLIGPPPGYVGYRETLPLLSQQNLDRSHTADTKLSIVLFDEIEKASETLWQLLLGILDRASLTLGDNRTVDFSRTIIVMTSNLGAFEMAEAASGGIGFATTQPASTSDEDQLNQNLHRAGINAARRRFSPEFMNRIDKTIVFQSLTEDQLRGILDLELRAVQARLLDGSRPKFLFRCSDEVKAHLLNEGRDVKYGARHLKRAIERLLVLPLSTLIATEQVGFGDVVAVELDEEGRMTFSRHSTGALEESLAAPVGAGPTVTRREMHGGRDTEMATQVAIAAAAVLTAVTITLGAQLTSNR
jgi:ATP-dependent Clp protease ATP-binding subunit ClpA